MTATIHLAPDKPRIAASSGELSRTLPYVDQDSLSRKRLRPAKV